MTTRIRALLSEEVREDFKIFLRKNVDVFVWLHEDMPGIDPDMIAH